MIAVAGTSSTMLNMSGESGLVLGSIWDGPATWTFSHGHGTWVCFGGSGFETHRGQLAARDHWGGPVIWVGESGSGTETGWESEFAAALLEAKDTGAAWQLHLWGLVWNCGEPGAWVCGCQPPGWHHRTGLVLEWAGSPGLVMSKARSLGSGVWLEPCGHRSHASQLMLGCAVVQVHKSLLSGAIGASRAVGAPSTGLSQGPGFLEACLEPPRTLGGRLGLGCWPPQ